jgi:hypothetical protein
MNAVGNLGVEGDPHVFWAYKIGHEEEVLNVGGGKSSVLFRYGGVEQNHHHGFESSRVCRDCVNNYIALKEFLNKIAF